MLLLLFAGHASCANALTVMSDYEDGFATFYGARAQRVRSALSCMT